MARRKSVLLIDDEPDVTMLVSSLLEFNDYRVTTINDPLVVMELVRKETFDVIVTDIMMPNLDGMELLRQILKSGKNNKVKLVALSAKDFRKEEYKFFIDNNVLIIKKPYEPQDLLDKINGLFEE